MITVNPEILLIGIGNEWRCDDGIGLDVARHVQSLSISGVQVVLENRDGISLDEVWRGWSKVIVVDAMCSGADPGTVLRIDANSTHLKPGAFPQSVHAFGLSEAVELSRIMEELPACLVIYGIEGREFKHGTDYSSEVRLAGETTTARILDEIERLRTGTGGQGDA